MDIQAEPLPFGAGHWVDWHQATSAFT